MLEPVLSFDDLSPGRIFAAVPLWVDDALVDAYLAATGLRHERLGSSSAKTGGEGEALVPMSLITMVRYAKTAIAGRWPSGTVQLEQKTLSRRALRRGERLSLVCSVAYREVIDQKAYFELRLHAFDSTGACVGESGGRSLWGGPGPRAPAVSDAGAGPADPRHVAEPARSTASLLPFDHPDLIGPLNARFPMDRLQAFGEVAAARDPIHLDPVFARSTPYGRNIAQGRLVVTMIEQLMLDHLGLRWLEKGWLSVRFRRPVFVDEPLQAWALPEPATQSVLAMAYRLVCTNARGDAVIEGRGGLSE